MPFVVAVGDEPQRQRHPRQQQRPRIQIGDRAATREADAGHAMVKVLAVGAVDRLPVLQPLEHYEGRVQKRDRQQDQRQHERDDRRRLDGGLHRDHAHQQPQQVRAAVAHETRCGWKVVDQEAERGARRDRREHSRLLAVQVERDHRHRGGDDRAHPRRQTVDAVREVDHVHHRHEADDREHRSGVRHPRVGEREPADERQRDRLDRHSEVHDDHGRQHLPGQLDPRRQFEAVVERADRRDDRRTEEHAMPELSFLVVAGGQPDQTGDERAGEDREPPQQRRGTFRETALARLIDHAQRRRDPHRDRSQQRGHRRCGQKGVKRVELVRMRHRLAHSIAGAEVAGAERRRSATPKAGSQPAKRAPECPRRAPDRADSARRSRPPARPARPPRTRTPASARSRGSARPR